MMIIIMVCWSKALTVKGIMYCVRSYGYVFMTNSA